MEPGFIVSWRRIRGPPCTDLEFFQQNIHRDSRIFVGGFDIKASCNGLILLYNIIKNYRVANPITGHWLQLPPPKLWNHDSYGFAFDPLARQYKVIGLWGHKCEILTVGPSTSWREVVLPSYDLGLDPKEFMNFYHKHPVWGNGALHWVVFGGNTRDTYESFCQFDPCKDRLLSMEVSNETFRITQHPNGAKGSQCYLLEMEGSLSFFDFIYPTHLDIWVLQDYSNQVWLKKYSLGIRSKNFWKGWYSPLAFVENGRFIVFATALEDIIRLFSCDHKLHALKRIRTYRKHLDMVSYLFLCPHVNSLVSLAPHNFSKFSPENADMRTTDNAADENPN
ncbi:F-box/kelch-repeat protein At3g06240-like [Tasmannia lanceolata]|uniref:F-box/kelch-repeat protein At3g06240-like n=1 Tax=Tasmannia lanceolata TaxID=3420 RepID=UPI0040631DF6